MAGLMKPIKLIGNSKTFVFLLAIFLTSTLAEGPHDFIYDRHNTVITGNIAQVTNSYAENYNRVKHNYFGIVFKYQHFCFNFPILNYLYIIEDSWSPRDIHLPTKSDRAPPGKIFS
jgi:hypothetical protein